MGLPAATALTFGVLPALAGAGVGLALLRPARRAAVGRPDLRSPARVLHAALGVAVAVALAASWLATQVDGADAQTLLAVGVASGACCALQGRVGGRGFQVVAHDVTTLGRVLVGMALPLSLVLVAVLAFLASTFMR